MSYNRPRSRTGTGSFFLYKMVRPPMSLDKNGNYHSYGDYQVDRLVTERIYPTSQNFLGNVRQMGKYYKKRVGGTTQRVMATVVIEESFTHAAA